MTDEQLEFPVLYGSAKYGWASSIFTKNLPDESKNMSHLLDAIVQHVPAPAASLDSPLQILVGIGVNKAQNFLLLHSIFCTFLAAYGCTFFCL